MLRRSSGAFYAAFLALSLFAASDALAWWNDSWSFRKEITFDASAAAADVPETSADVPVLIRLSLANFSYFADAKPDGSHVCNLLFTMDGEWMLVITGTVDKQPIRLVVPKIIVTK